MTAFLSGYYPCYLCEDNRIWINKGETLKIGITTVSTRYSLIWLAKNNINYIVEVTGDLATVRKAEIRKIAEYPLYPENLKRPKSKRLIVPPFHKTIRLK